MAAFVFQCPLHPSVHPMLSRRTSIQYLGIVTALALTALVFWPALSGGFIFDDYPIFAENPVVQIHGWQWQAWQSLWTWSHANIQRPLAVSSYALNYAIGANTWGFKATNLTIHLLNTVLVYLLGRRLLSAAWTTPVTHGGISCVDCWAGCIGLLWAIHPLQVSAVMYVVQRMELMGFTFVLLALLAYWRARQRQLAAQRAWPWLLLTVLITLVGYTAKETAILVPGYALLLELTILRFKAARPATSRTWRLAYAFGCVAALAVITGYLLPHYATTAAFSQRDYTAWQRELTQLRVLPMYLQWCVLPLPDQLHFYYDNYVASTSLLQPISTLLGGLLLLGLTALAIIMRQRRPLFALGIGWFFVAHVITSSPLALELVFEHRNYPALFGVILAAADLLQFLAKRFHPRLAVVIAVVVALNFGFLTELRAKTWGSPLQLAQTLVAMNPGSPRAALDLARRYVAMAGDNPNTPVYLLCIQELERAAALPTSSILPEQALLIQAANHPGLFAQPWWDSLQEKLRTHLIGPETYRALYGLLQARLGASPGIDAQQLSKALEIAIARDPARASLHAEYADLASLALHDSDLAAEQWRQALALGLQKNSPSYAIQVAGYLVENHRDQEALGVIAEAQNIEPALRGNSTLESLRGQAQQGLDKAANAHQKTDATTL
jgi:protein O-mannosyl-transferase